MNRVLPERDNGLFLDQQTTDKPTLRANFSELRKAEVQLLRIYLPRTPVNRARRRAEALPLALSQITCLLCLDEFDALSLLRHAGEDGVYLHSQEHHKTRHVEPEHEHYHRPQLAVDLPVVAQVRHVVA